MFSNSSSKATVVIVCLCATVFFLTMQVAQLQAYSNTVFIGQQAAEDMIAGTPTSSSKLDAELVSSQLAVLKSLTEQLAEMKQHAEKFGSSSSTSSTAAADPKTGLSAWQPKSSALACPAGQGGKDLVFTDGGRNKKYSKSQYKEDEILMKWFGSLCNGTYLEMGALDGVLYSNSHAFHRAMGWKGVLLEASPINFEKLKVNRPLDTLIHAGVCGEPGDLHWLEGKYSATGGFWEFASEYQRAKFFKRGGYESAKIVRCDTLKELLKQNVGEQIYFDFFSLDIEGAEFAALQTLDYDKVSFGIICVEASGQNELKDMAVRRLLESKGYRHFRIEGMKEVGFESDWFVNQDWPNIYKDLIYAI